MIATWWADLSLVMKVLWGVTLSASLIFLIQSILTFVGADADSDFDMDIDSSMDGSDLSNIEGGSNLYTFRNLVNFILGFGWSAILLQEAIPSVKRGKAARRSAEKSLYSRLIFRSSSGPAASPSRALNESRWALGPEVITG